MFGRLSFGSVRGIPISASGSWLLVVFALIWFVGDHLFTITSVSRTAATLLAAVTVLLFFVSIVGHELGHAFTAQRAGLKVEGIELWLFGGFAKLSESPRTPGEELRIAVAGPVVSLMLAILFLGGALLVDPTGLSNAATGDNADPWVAIAVLIGTLNLAVLVLNLLPAYPLDGGRIARALAWKLTGDPHRATRVAATTGQAIGFGLFAAGTVVALQTGSAADGISIALLGWLIAVAARSSLVAVSAQERLDKVTVGAIADPTVSAVEGHHTVLEATDNGGPPGRWIVVRRAGRPPALLSADALHEALAKGQPALTLAELVDDFGDRTINGDTPLRTAAVDARLRDGGPLLALNTEGEPLGVVTGTTLARAVSFSPKPR